MTLIVDKEWFTGSKSLRDKVPGLTSYDGRNIEHVASPKDGYAREDDLKLLKQGYQEIGLKQLEK